MQYYGAFYSTALHPLLKRINAYLLRWLRKNYKRLQGYKRAKRCWDGINPPGPWHVCPLAVEPCGLVIRRQEPGGPRGSRRDLWELEVQLPPWPPEPQVRAPPAR
jgi:hypothetical protein